MYERLCRHVPRRSHAPGTVPSAVLAPILAYPEGDRLLFTKRSDQLGAHRGQVCFPGGKRSPEDPDLVATALREAEEEVGIRPQDVEILGVLDDVATLTGFTITPVVGMIRMPYAFRPCRGEIDRLLEVPVRDLLAAGAFALTTQLGPGGVRVNLYSFEAEGELVWGATARIARQFVEVLKGGGGMLVPEVSEPFGEGSVDR